MKRKQPWKVVRKGRWVPPKTMSIGSEEAGTYVEATFYDERDKGVGRVQMWWSRLMERLISWRKYMFDNFDTESVWCQAQISKYDEIIRKYGERFDRRYPGRAAQIREEMDREQAMSFVQPDDD